MRLFRPKTNNVEACQWTEDNIDEFRTWLQRRQLNCDVDDEFSLIIFDVDRVVVAELCSEDWLIYVPADPIAPTDYPAEWEVLEEDDFENNYEPAPGIN